MVAIGSYFYKATHKRANNLLSLGEINTEAEKYLKSKLSIGSASSNLISKAGNVFPIGSIKDLDSEIDVQLSKMAKIFK